VSYEIRGDFWGGAIRRELGIMVVGVHVAIYKCLWLFVCVYNVYALCCCDCMRVCGYGGLSCGCVYVCVR